MKKNNVLSLTLLLCLGLSSQTFAHRLHIHHGADSVERAGTIIVKKYGPHDYAILVGEDRRHKFWNFPGGGVEKKDKYTSQTASRETYEETAKLLRYGGRFLAKQPYVYSSKYKTQLFVVRDDQMSIRKLNREVKKINQMKQLPHAYREISAYRAIPVKNIIQAAECIKKMNHPRGATHGCYFVVSRGNPHQKQPGTPVRLERHYLGVIADDLANFKAALRKLAP